MRSFSIRTDDLSDVVVSTELACLEAPPEHREILRYFVSRRGDVSCKTLVLRTRRTKRGFQAFEIREQVNIGQLYRRPKHESDGSVSRSLLLVVLVDTISRGDVNGRVESSYLYVAAILLVQ